MVILLLFTMGASSAENRRAAARRLDERPRLDGDLSAGAWVEAPPIGVFTQREPKPGAPPTEPTEVRVAYTKDHLYIAVRCMDSQPSSIFATQMARNANLERDDRIEILLDTFQDGRNAYYFATSPAGAPVDGRITESGKPNLEWDGVWNVRTRIGRGGWTA
jgi:hypothetical protein